MLCEVLRDLSREGGELVFQERLEVRVRAPATVLIFQCMRPCFLPLLLEKLVKVVRLLPHLFQL